MLKLWCENRKLRKANRSLEGRLAAEIDRNRAREDELINRVLTSRGEFGLSVPHAPVAEKPPEAKTGEPPKITLPFNQEDCEFWEEDAEAYGYTRAEGRENYEQYLKTGEMPFEESSQ